MTQSAKQVYAANENESMSVVGKFLLSAVKNEQIESLFPLHWTLLNSSNYSF